MPRDLCSLFGNSASRQQTGCLVET